MASLTAWLLGGPCSGGRALDTTGVIAFSARDGTVSSHARVWGQSIKATALSTRERAQATFATHLEYLSSGRIKEWVDLFADDGVLEFPYGPDDFPEKVSGKAALNEYMQNFPKIFDV